MLNPHENNVTLDFGKTAIGARYNIRIFGLSDKGVVSYIF